MRDQMLDSSMAGPYPRLAAWVWASHSPVSGGFRRDRRMADRFIHMYPRCRVLSAKHRHRAGPIRKYQLPKWLPDQ